MDVISESVEGTAVKTLLDLGCGTGRYSRALANHLKAFVVGIEPSAKMLSEAKKKLGDPVAFVRGRGESLPLADNSIDMVFISMVLHHFNDAGPATRKCRRVLRPGKLMCLRAGTTEQIDNYAYVPFFPETRPLLERSLAQVRQFEG